MCRRTCRLRERGAVWRLLTNSAWCCATWRRRSQSGWQVAVLLAYLAVVLRVSFGNQVSYALLTCLTGCIAGVSLGVFIGTFARKGEGVKTAILIGSSMTMSFLAGLMIVNMKDIIARRAPFLSYINPATLITDAFYSLYVFDNHRRFFLNVGLLILISSVMCILSVLRLRRDRYASL